MAVHTFKAYSESINRFSPAYDDAVCDRVARIQPVLDRLMASMMTQFMMLDMLKAYAFYGKELHECIEFQLPTSGSGVTARTAMFWHGVLGLLTEVNEAYIECTSKGFSKVNGVGETGDGLWFLNELSKAFGVTLAEAAAVNEAKLSTRYGDAHDAGKALKRDKFKEELAMSAALEEVRRQSEDKPMAEPAQPVGWREKFCAAFTMSGRNSHDPEMLFRVWGNGTMSIALPEHVTQFIEIDVLGEYDPDKDVRLKADVHEEHALLRVALSPLEDACQHNASMSQRITAARIREILDMRPRYFKHGKNYNGRGEEVTIQVQPPAIDPTLADTRPSVSPGGRPSISEPEQL